jgi:hypothetical protein
MNYRTRVYNKIIKILNPDCRYLSFWVDKRKTGYRMKIDISWGNIKIDKDKIEQIENLPHVIKTKVFESEGECHYGKYTYKCLSVYFDCKPSLVEV